jgi:hypothetical protein
MNWKTAMYLDLMEAQFNTAEHDRTIQTLESLVKSDPEHAELWRGCLEKIRAGYDL